MPGPRERTFAHWTPNAHSGEVAEPTDIPASPPTQPPSGLTRFAERAPWRRLPHPLRWLTVAIIGGTFVVAGIAMLVLPGPGIAFILLGLAILATEFVWAETLLHRVKNGSQTAWRVAKSKIKRDGGSSATTTDAPAIQSQTQRVASPGTPNSAPQSE